MRVTELGGSAVLVLGDAREVDFAELPAFDAVVTDPPYGINYLKGKHGSGGPGDRADRSKRKEWRKIAGDAAPFDPAWVCGLSRNVLLCGADHFARRLPEGSWWLAWDKLAGRQPWDSFSDVEFVWHSLPGKSEIIPLLWKGIACEKAEERDSARRYHPTQKPVRLMRWLIERAGAPRVVLDPYMGSGTTGVACARMGIGFVGIELDPEYYESAVKRVREELEA